MFSVLAHKRWIVPWPQAAMLYTGWLDGWLDDLSALLASLFVQVVFSHLDLGADHISINI